jgi:hypothetical protein
METASSAQQPHLSSHLKSMGKKAEIRLSGKLKAPWSKTEERDRYSMLAPQEMVAA